MHKLIVAFLHSYSNLEFSNSLSEEYLHGYIPSLLCKSIIDLNKLNAIFIPSLYLVSYLLAALVSTLKGWKCALSSQHIADSILNRLLNPIKYVFQVALVV